MYIHIKEIKKKIIYISKKCQKYYKIQLKLNFVEFIY